ncbi:MAG: MFS transporter [Alicyclobacillus sp.]|nr:MFS transporter [Alicyclobacillus sp.]
MDTRGTVHEPAQQVRESADGRTLASRTRERERTVLHLQIARTLRSVSQGIAVVDLALYLKQLGWSGSAIGAVLSFAGAAGAALMLLVGVWSDRTGRKPFLFVYESLTAIAALAMVWVTQPLILSLIIVLTGFGRGQNGAAGPFTPAEQAWMAACVPLSVRGRVFSTNTALGFFGMAAGSLLAGLPRLWERAIPGALSYRPLFGLMCALSVACAIVILTAPEGRSETAPSPGLAPAAGHRRDPHANHPAERGLQAGEGQARSLQEAHPEAGGERAVRRQENRNLAKLAAVNALNGLAIGFMGPMMAYWFSARYGASAAAIGTTLAVSFAVTGVSSLLTGRLTQRFGMVRSVVWLQVSGVLMLALLPLMPTFAWASLLYVVRSALSRGTQGARSALSSSLTRDHRRGFSVSLNSLVVRLASAAGPTVSGALLDAGLFAVPVVAAALLQLASSLLYGRLFRSFDELAKAEGHG